jgi:hypothetical protein
MKPTCYAPRTTLLLIFSFILIFLQPTKVSAIGVSPGKIDLGYVLPTTTTTIQLNLSRGNTSGLQGFIVSAHGEGATALSLQKKFIPFTDVEDTKKITITFKFDRLKIDDYQPYLEITPKLDNYLDVGTSKTLPSLKVVTHFTLTTTSYSNISSYPVSLYFISSNTLKITSEIDNKGTGPAIIQGIKIKPSNSKKIFPLFFKQAIIIPSKTKKTIDERIPISSEIFSLNDVASFSWLLPSSETAATATIVQKYIPKKQIAHNKLFVVNFLTMALILLFVPGSAILYTTYLKKDFTKLTRKKL